MALHLKCNFVFNFYSINVIQTIKFTAMEKKEEIIEENENKEKVNGIRSFPKYDINPFLEGIIPNTKGKTVGMSKKPIDVGEATGEEAFIYLRKEVDKERFMKIYIEQMRMLFDLSSKSLKVFGYICESLPINGDRIIFDIEEAKKYTGYTTDKSIFLAKTELLEKGFLARTKTSNVYYINLNVYFNGDRLVVINDYNVISEKSTSGKINKKEKEYLHLKNTLPFNEKI